MKLPRNITGEDLCKLLKKFGYVMIRQTGSHIRLMTNENGNHRITVPFHFPVRVGTLFSIVKDVAEHFGLTVEEVKERLFGDG